METFKANEFEVHMRDFIEADSIEAINLSEIKWWIVNACKYIKDLQESFAVVVQNITFTTAELAKLLGVAERTITRWRETKSIPFERKGWAVYFKYEEVFQAICDDQLIDKRFDKERAKERLEKFKKDTIRSYAPVLLRS